MPAGTLHGEATVFSGADSANQPRRFAVRWLSIWCAFLIFCVGCSKERLKAASDEILEQRGDKWHLVNGSDLIGFKLHAKGPVDALRGKVTPVLVIICDRGPTSVMVQAPTPASGDVSYAFDDALPKQHQWGVLADSEMLAPWSAERPSFVAQMLKAKTLSFEYRSLGEPAQSSTFNLLDIADLMGKDQRCAAVPPTPKPRK